MIYRIVKKDKELFGEVNLVSSKSESNRVLLIKQLCGADFTIHNLSEATDTKIMKEILEKISLHEDEAGVLEFDVGNSGTVMRFCTSYLATQKGTYIMTGSERMKQRPIGILVNALQNIGAQIEFLEKKGFPPIKITGQFLKSREIEIEANVSSQFTTAMMLIAPTLPEGLILKLRGNVVSRPYIEMTMKIMKHFGVNVMWQGNNIIIPPQKYKPKDYRVGADWTSASYIYEAVAFANKAEVKIKGLLNNKMQGDVVIAKLYKTFGIHTKFVDDGVILTKKNKFILPTSLRIDFTNYPDLAQSLAVTCAGLNIETHFTGLENLNIKETERLNVLCNELCKLKYVAEIIKGSSLKILPSRKERNFSEAINTYGDHRMAMSFAPLALLLPEVKIENPDVTDKSYPGYWSDLKKLGFEITSI